MEGRIGITIVCMILLAGAIAGQHYWRLHDRTQELADLKVLLHQAQTNLQTKENRTKERGRTLDAAKGLAGEYKSLGEEQAELVKQVSALEAQNAEIQKRFVDAVMKVRKAAADLPPQDIVLKSGQVLTAAKVQRMSDSEMTFQHAGGISRVDVNDLPPEVRDRFRQQMSPFTVEGGIKEWDQ
jgi:hypothetical protein